MDVRELIEKNFQIYDNHYFIDGDKPIDNLNSYLNQSKEWSTDDLALVHATNFFPDGIIYNLIDGKKEYKRKDTLSLDGEKRDIDYIYPRTTTHFSLNGKVGNNDGGNWNNIDYFVIEPLSNQINEITNVFHGDSYFNRTIQLSNDAVFLIKKEKYDSMDKSVLKGKNIFIFTGNDNNVINQILLYMGYKPQTMTNYGWVNYSSCVEFNKYFDKMKKNNPNLTTGMHSMSYYSKMESSYLNISVSLSYIRNGEKIDLSERTEITKKELIELYNRYINDNIYNTQHVSYMKNEIKKDSIESFNEFLKEFYIINDNGRFFIESCMELYKNKKEYLVQDEKNNLDLYNDIIQFQKDEIEKLLKLEQEKKQEKINVIFNEIENIPIKQIDLIVENYPDFKYELYSLIKKQLRIEFDSKSFISYDRTKERVIINDGDNEELIKFAENLPGWEFRDFNEYKNMANNDLTIIQVQEILSNIYNNYLNYINKEKLDEETLLHKMGFVAIKYVFISLLIVLILLISYFFNKVG